MNPGPFHCRLAAITLIVLYKRVLYKYVFFLLENNYHGHCILGYFTLCPGSSDPFFIVNDYIKMDYHFLDRQYMKFLSKLGHCAVILIAAVPGCP